jgi:GTPase SAR1 family protein
MGKINSKSKYNYRFPTMFHSSSSLCHRKKSPINICDFHNKSNLCMKKKVLILGLDGVGKTDLFTRLISHEKQSTKINPLPRPTIGKSSFPMVRRKKTNFIQSRIQC